MRDIELAWVTDTHVELIDDYIKQGDGDLQWHDCTGRLIRCKDCQYYRGYGAPCDRGIVTHADGFCDRAVLREEITGRTGGKRR